LEPSEDPDVIAYSLLLRDSFERWTKTLLLANAEDPTFARQLYEADFVLVSHGVEADPVFRYANRKAQQLWKMDWRRFTQTPSRLSAKPDAREDRQCLLEEAALNGYVSNYRGVRVASDGQTFYIEDTLLWNVVDAKGVKHGQAAMFTKWTNL
jgi:hypothetical protein